MKNIDKLNIDKLFKLKPIKATTIGIHKGVTYLYKNEEVSISPYYKDKIIVRSLFYGVHIYKVMEINTLLYQALKQTIRKDML